MIVGLPGPGLQASSETSTGRPHSNLPLMRSRTACSGQPCLDPSLLLRLHAAQGPPHPASPDDATNCSVWSPLPAARPPSPPPSPGASITALSWSAREAAASAASTLLCAHRQADFPYPIWKQYALWESAALLVAGLRAAVTEERSASPALPAHLALSFLPLLPAGTTHPCLL